MFCGYICCKSSSCELVAHARDSRFLFLAGIYMYIPTTTHTVYLFSGFACVWLSSLHRHNSHAVNVKCTVGMSIKKIWSFLIWCIPGSDNDDAIPIHCVKPVSLCVKSWEGFSHSTTRKLAQYTMARKSYWKVLLQNIFKYLTKYMLNQ